jgi:hypothetical protein
MTRKPSTWRNLFGRRVRRTVLAMGLAVVATVATAGAAAAGRLHQQTCTGERDRYTICLYITDDPQSPYSNHYKVHVGIDINMTEPEAEAIIARSNEMSARMYGADPAFDDNLQGVTRSWRDAWEGGLSIEFDRSMSGGTLNEDPEGGDEVYALVRVYVPVSGVTRTFRSDTVVAHF